MSSQMPTRIEENGRPPKLALAIVSPGNHAAPDPGHSNSALVSPKDDRIWSVSDQDVLCGRGKGMRKHPGNDLYNKLLREHYEEYKSAPKGSKLSIVKKIVDFVREGQASGRGRFLERKLAPKSVDSSKNASSKWFYVDIGNERAMNKTAQAFRDIRVTMERHHAPNRSILPQNPAKIRMTSDEDGLSDHSGSTTTSSSLGKAAIQMPRRPTFRERLAMLEREQQRNGESSNNEESSDDDGEEISDTETEDSFPMYSCASAKRKTKD